MAFNSHYPNLRFAFAELAYPSQNIAFLYIVKQIANFLFPKVSFFNIYKCEKNLTKY